MSKIRLLRDLNCYRTASTGGQPLKMLKAGVYRLERLRLDFPDADTDFAQIRVPRLDRSPWVCTRWQQKRYAEREPELKRPIPERAIVDLLPEFAGYRYSLRNPRYPFELAGVKVPLEPPAANNCCTFVEALLVRAFQQERGAGFQWSRKLHGQMMISSLADVFSPVTAALESGMATAKLDPDALPWPWTIAQGWRESPDDAGGRWKGGHTFLVLDAYAPNQRILTLESNDAFGMSGPGYRVVGDLDRVPHPGARWFEQSNLWTWADFRRAYRHVQLAKLDVDDVRWVRGG